MCTILGSREEVTHCVTQWCAPLAVSPGGLPGAAPGQSPGQLSIFYFNFSTQVSHYLSYEVSATEVSNVKCLNPTSTMQE